MGNTRANADVRGARSFAQCVSLVISNSAVVEDKSEFVSFPGPAQLFVAVGTEKWAGPGNEASPNRARRTVRGAFSLGEVTAAQVTSLS